MKQIVIALLLFLISFSSELHSQELIDVSVELGLTHLVVDNNQPNFGGGVSFVDIDKNGFDDIIISNGENQSLSVFLNQDGDSFITHDFGFDESFNNDSEMSAWADYDNDGDLDLYITYDLSRNRLYRQDPGFTFTDVSESSGIDFNSDRSSSAVWADFDNDGHLDLFVATFLESSNGGRNLYFNNNGDGTFQEMAVSAGVDESKLALSATAFDYDDDGLVDLYVTNDKSLGNQLFKNLGNKVFQDVSIESGAGIKISGMGIAIGDYDNDGDFDIYAANEPPSNVLLENNGDGTFVDVTSNQRVENGNLCWGGIFADFNLDGWSDLHVSVSGIDYDGNGNKTNGFYINRNGSDLIRSFVEANEAGINQFEARSWGSALGDYNNDGLQDVVVYNDEQNFALWKNMTATTNNWIKFDLEGTASNRDGIGAKLILYSSELKQINYRNASMGYKSQSSSTLTFSLGQRTHADSVEVIWPSGNVNTWYNLDGQQKHLLVESATSTISDQEIPPRNKLKSYPNPFSQSINFDFGSIERLESFVIFDALGREVYSNNEINPRSSLLWNGKDKAGTIVAPGLYFATVSIDSKRETIRFLKQ